MYSSAYVWAKVLGHMESRLTPQVVSTWFDDTEILELTDEKLVLYSPSSFRKDIIVRRCTGYIKEAMQEIFQMNVEVEVLDETEIEAYRGRSQKPEFIEFNPQFTFDNFVVGSSNRFAHAAALAVAEQPGMAYNPLFLYGGVGLGKTHLMQAIGHQYIKTHPGARVRCISAQQYINEFTDAVRGLNNNHPEKMQTFENRYQNLDLLLIDDIQSFASREGTQTNFFLAFERMVPHGKQIVLTSDTYPRNLKAFQERLLSRLTQGLVVSVEPPELDMRIQILLQKADRSGLEMPEEVAVIIAKRLKSNVRELEGAVQQILAYTNFHNLPVSVETAKVALRDVFNVSAVPVTVENIQQVVSEYYNLKVSDMYSKSRKGPVVYARQIAMYLAKELTQKSLPEIASFFGKKDHTTVMYACKKVMTSRNTDEALKHELNILEQRLKN